MNKNSNPLVSLRNLSGILFVIWLIFSPTPEPTYHSSSIQTVTEISSGGSNLPRLGRRKMMNNNQPQNIGSNPTQVPKESSVSTGEYRSDGTKLRYSSLPDNSGNGNSDDPNSCSNNLNSETCPTIPDKKNTISNPEFWNYISKRSETCDIDSELANGIEEDEIEDDVPDIPEEIEKEEIPRRRLLAVTKPPTGELDRAAMKANDETTIRLPLFKYEAYDKRKLTMGDYATKKVAYSHQGDLAIPFSDFDRFECTIQDKPGAFSRLDCFTITDENRMKVIKEIFELTTTTSKTHVVLKMPMPYKPDKKCYAYLDLRKGTVAYFTLDGRLWSADSVSSNTRGKWMADPNIEKNPQAGPKETYEYFRTRNQCQANQKP